MAINQQDWNAVRAAVGGGEQLYRRVEQPITELDEETGEETTRKVVSYVPVEADASAKASFDRIESDVERLVQEVQSLQVAERELRTALEEPTQSTFQRR